MKRPEAAGAIGEAIIEEAARAYARRWGLIDEQGMIWCAHCKRELALMPSLHCGRCLGAEYSRLHIVSPCCVNHAQVEQKERIA